MSRVFVPGFEDGERVRRQGTGDSGSEGTAKRQEHGVVYTNYLLVELFEVSEHREEDGTAEASLEDVGCDASIESCNFTIVIEVPAGNRYVLEEV